MALIGKILNWTGLTTIKNSKRAAQRAFEAARSTRLRIGWTAYRQEINREIQSDLPALRARAYDMLFNNAFVAAQDFDDRYFVVGPEGFDLQPQTKFPSGALDDFANAILKKKFDKWCKKQFCSVSQRYPFVLMQYMMCTMMRIDGEVILRKYTKGSAVKNNPFGFTIDFIDANDIDHNYNLKVDDDTFIIMGVQVDSFRRIQGIWLKNKNIQDELTQGYNAYRSREFIPGNELIFGFDPKHYKQIHGVTNLASVMITLKDADMWKGYSLQNAKASAAKMGFLIDKHPDAHEYRGAGGDTEENDSISNEPGKYMDMESASIEELPYGKEFAAFDPKFPSDQHDPYMRSLLREASFGTGKDYAVLTGDREGESFSSGRGGELKSIGAIAYFQTIIRETLLIPVYEAWLESALRAGELAPLVYANKEKYLEHYWQGYKKGWIDPYKKSLSDKIDEEMGWKSKIDNLSERARRIEDVFADKLTYQKMKETHGVDIETIDKTNIQVVENNSTGKEEEENKTNKRDYKNIIRLHEVNNA